ncbi:hypothetical protein KQX54_006699 [Cotesia glomerata]|uniref:Uncharacterized protein n=1 Tax=Cotesia glomerata TaxID=32391 RepID=A0AAV7J3B1_COTGL|nr:hypothetical protein KQX54_006699 [Cotesia glomerata]
MRREEKKQVSRVSQSAGIEDKARDERKYREEQEDGLDEEDEEDKDKEMRLCGAESRRKMLLLVVRHTRINKPEATSRLPPDEVVGLYTRSRAHKLERRRKISRWPSDTLLPSLMN